MKLALFDLDGTLFDTKYVNFYAYNEGLRKFGVSLEEKFFCEECNGRHYKTFLPKVLNTEEEIEEVHKIKKECYSKYLSKAKENEHLFAIVQGLKKLGYKLVVCTTASKKNTEDILEYFQKKDLFDYIITQEEVKEKKPNPEVFLKAMEYYHALPEETMIFEDADVGIEAARKTGATVFVVNKF